MIAYSVADVGGAADRERHFSQFEVYFTIAGMYLVISWMTMTMFAAISRRYFSYPVR